MDASIPLLAKERIKSGMSFTESQRRAIEVNGNLLVVAGAGAGKTSTLVERCVARLLDFKSPVGLDEILMVTFTEAAASEMKQRIRARLEKELDSARDEASLLQLEEQRALLDACHIGTLHSFCLRLIREHAHELALDPQVSVLTEEQAILLMDETLDELLRKHYAGETADSPAVQELIAAQSGGWERTVRDLIFRLHHYSQTQPDPDEWYQQQLREYRQPEPETWRRWLLDGFRNWRNDWLPELLAQPVENERAHRFATRLRELGAEPSRETIEPVLQEIIEVSADWPHGTRKKFHDPIEEFYKDAAFLNSVANCQRGTNPLRQDWDLARPQMEAILCLAEEFSKAFASAKRDQGGLDFHDFEQFALRLLWDNTAAAPRPLAGELRRKFKLAFVDEYQDINPAQDRIIRAISREGPAGNCFLVGDVKQSIYRFRLANPHIFQRYRKDWSLNQSKGSVISLSDNFRSREMLLRFINPIFAALMREGIGGVTCRKEDELVFAAPEVRAPLSVKASPEPRVEVHLRISGKNDENNDDEDSAGNETSDTADWTDAEIEARWIARRLKNLVEEQHQVWDSHTQSFRSVRWSDIVILLRSLRNKAETYAKEFHRVGVPLEAERTGFYDNTEVTDLLSLLQLLDNPIQDVPLLAVLRSPLVGLSLNELAGIRLAARGTHLWTALKRWQEAERKKASKRAATLAKVDSFLKRYNRWRRVGRERSLSQQLEVVLDETHYREWLQTQSRAEQRLANLRHLLVLAQRFDPFQRQGVQRFLRFVEAQRGVQVDSEPAPVDAVDAVRLMSIHKSKGLEFPVVVLAGLGARFNMRDLSDQMILDEEYGLCPQIKPTSTGARYPSLPWWLAGKRQRREALGEEMRLLYVAMTRARDTLLLVGTVSGEKTLKTWAVPDEGQLTDRRILKARGYLDWLGPLLTGLNGDPDWINQASGAAELFRWRVDSDGNEFVRDVASTKADGESERLRSIDTEADVAALGRLKNRIEWRYPFAAAGNEPAKTSVSAIRRRADAVEDEARQEFRIDIDTGRRWIRSSERKQSGELSAAEAGTAHHQFLQAVALERTGTEAELRREAERLCGIGVLSKDEISTLDFVALDAFWQSEIGRSIRAQSSRVRRELPFTVRMSPADLEAVGLRKEHPGIENEFFVVQGAVDLAVILPDAISILDFKTDRVMVSELEERTRFHTPQLRLYALALERIYRRPVKSASLHFLALRRTVSILSDQPESTDARSSPGADAA